MPLVADYALPRLRESIRIHLTAEIAKEAQSTQKIHFAAFFSPFALRSPRSIAFVSSSRVAESQRNRRERDIASVLSCLCSLCGLSIFAHAGHPAPANSQCL